MSATGQVYDLARIAKRTRLSQDLGSNHRFAVFGFTQEQTEQQTWQRPYYSELLAGPAEQRSGPRCQ
ncbi:hypothetical protein VTN96DRAFT_861 [Rasamsonia emersonii]